MDQTGLVRVPLADSTAVPGGRPTRRLLPITRVPVATGSQTYALLEDREGNVWVGTSDGLDRFRDTQPTPVRFAGRIIKPPVAAGEGGTVWVGSVSDPLMTVGDRVVTHP